MFGFENGQFKNSDQWKGSNNGQKSNLRDDQMKNKLAGNKK